MGADQKMINVIPKYLDRDSLLPTPEPAPGQVQAPPVIKPNGYEVLHIVADGDALGYQFGLNKTMRPAPAVSEETGVTSGGTGGGNEGGAGNGGGGGNEGGGNTCGDPSGVEIWEWFDALQCWIEKEILPAKDLISLDDTCGAQAPAPKEDKSVEDIIDPAEDQSSVPSQINVVMGRKSLVVGEEEDIKIYPLHKY